LKKHNKETFSNYPNNYFPKTELVISQYHATLPEYKHCKIVKNVINFDEEIYNIKSSNTLGGKLKIAYSPSTLERVNKYYDKGYKETKEILESLSDILDFDIISGVSLEECLKRKAMADVIIDEVKTGSFHRSGLEGLCLSKLTICYLNKEVEKLMLNMFGSIPFHNVKMEKLKDLLILLTRLPREKIIEIGKKNREWMEKNWNPKDIANDFVKIYENL